MDAKTMQRHCNNSVICVSGKGTYKKMTSFAIVPAEQREAIHHLRIFSRSFLGAMHTMLWNASPFLVVVLNGLVSIRGIATALSMSSSSSAFRSPRNIVVVGGGVQGTSVAYQIAKNSDKPTNVVLLEAKEAASAASGKGGGFMARSWGDGTSTQKLHELAFDMYEKLAVELGCSSYRKLPVLSVSAGYKKGIPLAKKNPQIAPLLPNWLDGQEYGRISPMGYGDDTAQITPKEFVHAMLNDQSDKIRVVLGKCTGIETDQGSVRGNRKVVAVRYQPRRQSGGDDDNDPYEPEEQTLAADAVVVSAGPWSCAAEDWFPASNIELPMEGVKSTSIVWKKPSGVDSVDATALFCGEDDRFSTHLEVYPRPDGTIYLCGIGGSDYVSREDLKDSRFLEHCDAKEARAKAAKQSFQQMSSVYRSEGELDKIQACMRPCPPDAKPYMGRLPNYEGAYINAGHNCWGIAWAPACGKAMSELVLDGECRSVDLRPFDPSRFTPAARRGDRGRKRRGTSVGEQW